MKNKSGVQSKRENITQGDTKKKSYHSPYLQVYGNLSDLTKVKTGERTDNDQLPGNPKTKN